MGKVCVVFVLLAVTLSASAKDWWENGNFYQIYPRSFKDSNNDGIGDLNGITERLPHLKEIGVDGVWLSPIFKSPMVDFGYDISDYRAIQPEYGTMADFKRLADTCKSLGIRLILDYVPNHTSDKHEWFEKSVRREKGFENFYIWHPGKVNNVTGKREPPNNWLSIFRYSGWEWNEQRKEYYLHQFAIQQPDLNYRDPNVVKEMKDVLRFWLGNGVSGFRIDTIPNLFEVAPDKNGNYPDEPKSGDDNCLDPTKHCYLKHIYTADLNETYDMAYQWHEVLVEFQKQNGGDTRILMTEAYTSLDNIIRYYGDGKRIGSQIPFNFHFMSNINKDTSAKRYAELIDEWLKKVPKGAQANWVLGNHDQSRLGSRLGEKRVDLYNILLKTLPGISVNYNGEEIGMTDTIISWKDTVDPQACNEDKDIYHSRSRDIARTPIQWDDTLNAGFTKASKTWLPVNVYYYSNNVKIQKLHARSHLNVYKKLVDLRKDPAFVNGTYTGKVLNEDVLTYKREANGRRFIVALNLGKQWRTVNISKEFNLPNNLQVVVTSLESQYKEGEVVDGRSLQIPNDIGLVLSVP